MLTAISFGRRVCLGRGLLGMVDEYRRMGSVKNSDDEEILTIVVACMDLTRERRSVMVSSS